MKQISSPQERVEIMLSLHPADYARLKAGAIKTKMSEAEFYAVSLHIGSLAVLRDYGHRIE
ncbi:hypothetical protein P3T18_006088 [Paraburkholderia sp. GAS199]|uniref:hypothetical protein n=1 Tax=Paraburkholderia sp. GAS199 TaxID=3035126 RepID=UPI003D1F1061